MKTVNLRILAAFIEYHWWCVECLQKKLCHRQSKKRIHSQNLHKLRAEQLSVIYEINIGLRDSNGKIIA